MTDNHAGKRGRSASVEDGSGPNNSELEPASKRPKTSDSDEGNATNNPLISKAKARLAAHIGIGPKPSSAKTVTFYVESAPSSPGSGATCRLPTCDEKIKQGTYRIAVCGVHKNADFYHVQCFEKIVDFTQFAYVDRIMPVTASSMWQRGLTGAALMDCSHNVNAGAEKLVMEWKQSMRRLIHERNGTENEPQSQEFQDLWFKSGSASYTPKRVAEMSDSTFNLLSRTLAPIESDGVDDEDEWNLLDEFDLPLEDLEDLDRPHTLSTILRLWKYTGTLATMDESRLTDIGKEKKEELGGEKAIRGIKRLLCRYR